MKAILRSHLPSSLYNQKYPPLFHLTDNNIRSNISKQSLLQHLYNALPRFYNKPSHILSHSIYTLEGRCSTRTRFRLDVMRNFQSESDCRRGSKVVAVLPSECLCGSHTKVKAGHSFRVDCFFQSQSFISLKD